MNREIKFRCFVKDENRMGSELSIEQILSSDEIFDNEDLENCIIMQFTGLKDKYGKDIYEGDILAFEREKNFVKTLVNRFEMKWNNYEKNMNGWTQFSPIEMIVVEGNIYQNPELIK